MRDLTWIRDFSPPPDDAVLSVVEALFAWRCGWKLVDSTHFTTNTGAPSKQEHRLASLTQALFALSHVCMRVKSPTNLYFPEHSTTLCSLERALEACCSKNPLTSTGILKHCPQPMTGLDSKASLRLDTTCVVTAIHPSAECSNSASPGTKGMWKR
jgi:hypothetical protein